MRVKVFWRPLRRHRIDGAEVGWRSTPTPADEGESMTKRFTGKIVIAILALVSAALLAVCGLTLYGRNVQTHEITIAAGKAKSEAFVMMQALKTVIARRNSGIRITVHETGGTEDNLMRLERGAAQLAVSQSDTEAPYIARTVAVLFDDVFQIVVRSGPAARATTPAVVRATAPAAAAASPIAGFESLQGKRIALAKTGGQFKAFLFLAAQYKLKEADFTFTGGDDATADEAFTRNEADAVFRVRSLPNPAIGALVADGGATFLPLDNAAALHARNPAYTATTIPKGTYSENPPTPSADVPTIEVHRVLLAGRDVNPDVVNAITEVLMTARPELASVIGPEFLSVRPLLAQIKQSALDSGVDPPLHPGANPDYQTKEGSFVWNHMNLLASAFALCVLVALWTAELRRHAAHVKKRRADAYNVRVAGLMAAAYRSESTAPIASELLTLFEAAVQDLKAGKLSSESFQSFHGIWKAAMDAASGHPGNAGNWQAVPAPSASSGEKSKWSLVKYLQPRSNS